MINGVPIPCHSPTAAILLHPVCMFGLKYLGVTDSDAWEDSAKNILSENGLCAKQISYGSTEVTRSMLSLCNPRQLVGSALIIMKVYST